MKKTKPINHYSDSIGFAGNASSISHVCHSECVYSFSSGIAISETVYSSNRGVLYNAASRVIVDGGRKALAVAAFAGMMVQNLQDYAWAGNRIGETVNAGETKIVSANDNWTSTTVSGTSANLYVYAGGSTTSTVVLSGGSEVIYGGGSATGTNIQNGGSLTLRIEGNAVNFRQNSGGIVNAEVYKPGYDGYGRTSSGGRIYGPLYYAFAEGENQFGSTMRLMSGRATNFVVNNGGWLNVAYGGQASGVVQRNGGNINTIITKDSYDVNYSTFISGHNQNGSTFVLSNGVAENFIINNSGWVSVISGGSAVNLTQNAGGVIITQIKPGDSTFISGTNESGAALSLSGGIASNFILNRNTGTEEINAKTGTLDVYQGGKVYNVQQNSGALVNIMGFAPGDGTYISGINQKGETMTLSNGVADNLVVNDGGFVNVLSGGSATNLDLYGGDSEGKAILNIEQGGYVSNVSQIGSYAAISAVVAGGDTSTYLNGTNAGGAFSIENGVATNLSINGSEEGAAVYNGSSYRAGLTVLSGGKVYGLRTGEYANVNVNVYGNDTETVVSGSGPGDRSYTLSDGIASNFRVGPGGFMNVHSGGVAKDTLLYGNMNVLSGGSATNVYTGSGSEASVNVDVIGEDDKTVVSGSRLALNGSDYEGFSLKDGVASNFIVGKGGYMNVQSGGIANSTVLHGDMHISSGGSAVSTIINSGGSQYVSDGGSAVSTTINVGGWQLVYSGGYSYDYVINGGSQYLESGSIASGTIISGGAYSGIEITGSQTISNGASSIDVKILGGKQFVSSGGVAISTYIGKKGSQNVSSGGSALTTKIDSGGTQTVFHGGLASGTSIGFAGSQVVRMDAIVSDVTVGTGGNIYVYGVNELHGNTVVNSGGIVSLVHENSANSVLRIDNLQTSNGVFRMNVNLPAKTADRIVISGNHNGQGVLILNNIGSYATELTGNDLKLVEYSALSEGDGTFSLAGGVWDTGGYEYTLQRGNAEGLGKDYFLRGTKQKSYLFKTMANVPIMNTAAVHTAMNSLQKRLGDLREMNNPDAKNSVWARGYYKSMTVSDLVDTDMNVSGLEAGYDFKAWEGEEGSETDGNSLYLGFMAGAFNVSGIKTSGQNFNATGTGDGFLAGMYGTYLFDHGMFADFTLRGGNTSSDMTNNTLNLAEVNYTAKRNFVAASMEFGKSIITEVIDQKWKIEPKAEIRYLSMGKDNVNVENGVGNLSLGGTAYTGLTGTIYMSHLSNENDNLQIEPFAELSYGYEFSGEETVAYGGASNKISQTGGYLGASVGVNCQINQDTYWYLSAEYEKGNKIESVGGNVGIRYSFGFDMHKKIMSYSRQTETPKPVEERKEKKEESLLSIPKGSLIENQGAEEYDSQPVPDRIAPEAVNPAPKSVLTEHIKENYLKAAKKAKADAAGKDMIMIPSMGMLFKIGSSDVLPYYFPMLDAFAELYMMSDRTATVLVEGFSSNGGNETDKNHYISRARAINVRKYLTRKGIPAEKIQIRSYGNSKLASRMFDRDANCSGGQCYRRVNISIVR